MALLVQKFGGTSVGSIERIKNVARRCLAAQREGNKVVVIVSLSLIHISEPTRPY